jgi:hypothetical protein
MAQLNETYRYNWSEYLKECAERKRARAAKPEKNITNSITKRYDPFCEANCFPDDDLGHHRDCAYWKEEEARKIAADKTVTLPETSTAMMSEKSAIAESTEIMPENMQPAITDTQLSMTIRHLDKNWKFPPSVILKRIVMDDDFFPSAYDTLIGILDADMSKEESEAVWTLLRYLKRVEKSHQEAAFLAEMEFRLPPENHTEPQGSVIS